MATIQERLQAARAEIAVNSAIMGMGAYVQTLIMPTTIEYMHICPACNKRGCSECAGIGLVPVAKNMIYEQVGFKLVPLYDMNKVKGIVN